VSISVVVEKTAGGSKRGGNNYLQTQPPFLKKQFFLEEGSKGVVHMSGDLAEKKA